MLTYQSTCKLYTCKERANLTENNANFINIVHTYNTRAKYSMYTKYNTRAKIIESMKT